MPPPRRSSPRRRDRRSRSRSFSPRPYSPPRQSYSRRSPKNERRSPPRNRSRSPKRRSLSMDRGRPVKRVPADSSGRHMGYRSRSPSPVPAKRVFKEHKQETSGRRQSDKYSPERTQWRDRSASPSRQHRRASFEGKMYADKPSSSKIPEKEKSEIASVKIIDTHKREKLDKRFRTLEQLSQGPFDFEENITIGIHRGPQHMELAEDVPANYDIDMRSFVMLFPKRDKPQRIFDRDEIRAFRHDDILDEEAYVEKRTITMRPSEKQQRKYSDMDYKITIGHSSSSRDYDSDRRMVRDVSGKQTTRPSWNEADVTVRLDPKPDPRYERIYQDSQKKDDAHSSVQRNPNDLRHNLERRHKSHSGGDRDREYRSERDRDYDTKDARYQIESHRRGGGGGRSNERPRDRYRDDGVSSRPDDEVKRKPVKTELPDFKNRPVSPLRLPHVWIIGSSLVKDTQKYVQENSIGTDLSLQELLASVHWHGEMDMKIEDVLAAVHFLKKAHPAPQMIVIHCGDNNVCEGRNVDSHEVMQRDLKVIQEEFPGVRIVWSQILPTWNKSGIRPSTMSKSRRRINKFVGNDVLDFNGCLLLYPEFSSGEKQKLYLESSDGGFHLTNLGMKMFITRLRSGIKYFIEGHGTVFPYLKWPPEDITELSKTSIPMLNFDQVQDLKKKQLHKLSAKQIQAFTLEQIKMFSNHQVSEFDMQLCVSLTREQITGLTLKQVKLLSPKQFLYFKPEQVKWFTEEQNKVLKKMDMSEVERLKDERRERERKEAGSLRPPGEEEAVIKESRDRGRARRSRSPVRKGDTSRDRKSGRVRRSPSPVSRRTIRSREWSGRGRVRRSPSPGSRNSRDRGGDPGRQQWQGGRRASSGGGYTPSRRGRRRSSSSSSSGSRSPVGPRHNWSWHDGWPRQPDSYPSPYSVPPGVPHYPGLPGPAPFPQAGMPPHIPHPFPLSGPYAPPPGAPLPGVPLAPGAAPPLAPYAVAPGWPPQLPPGVHIVHPAAYSETFEEGPDTLSVPYLDRLDGDTNRAAAYNEKFTSYDDWQDNPESIPKGEGYYEHDTRDRNDMTYWERKQLFITTGRQFPMTNRGFRGRPGFTPRFRGRGFIRGGGRGFTRGIRRGFNNYNYRGGSFRGSYPNQRGTYPNQRGTYPNQRGTYSHYSNDDWKHDKYADLEKGEGEDQNQEETSKDEYEDVNQSNNAKNSISKSGDLKRKSEGSNGKVKTKDKKVKKDKKHKEHKKDKVKSKEKAKSHDNKNVKESGDYLEKGDKSKTDVGKQYELEIKEEVSIS